MIGKKITLEKHKDDRGQLIAVNCIPFDSKRMFVISDVPMNGVRGNHFSKTSRFLYVVFQGACRIELDNGNAVEAYKLEAGEGLLLPKRTWMRLYDFEENTILCILADKEYEPSDYIADYEEFKRTVREENV